jgi:hypothetical protein
MLLQIIKILDFTPNDFKYSKFHTLCLNYRGITTLIWSIWSNISLEWNLMIPSRLNSCFEAKMNKKNLYNFQVKIRNLFISSSTPLSFCFYSFWLCFFFSSWVLIRKNRKKRRQQKWWKSKGKCHFLFPFC